MAKINQPSFESTVEMIKRNIPGFSIKYKDETWIMKVLAVVLFFVKGFMTRFTTTLGATVYLPSRAYVEKDRVRAARILRHEYIHLWDRQNSPFLFSLGYIFPQVFSLLALLAIFFTNFWLLALVFLLPIPSPPRWRIEMRGYATSLLEDMDASDGDVAETRAWIMQCFTSSSYYWMCPFKKKVENMMDSFSRYFEGSGRIPFGYHAPYIDLFEIMGFRDE